MKKMKATRDGMNTAMINAKAQYSKYKFCQYLYVSSQTMTHAISLFSSTKEGDLERSFSAFHKAWLLLFQADILAGLGNGYLHACHCPDEKAFNCNDEKCIRKKTKKPKTVFGIEGALNEIRDTDKFVTELKNGYKFSDGHGIFKLINHKDNSYNNLSIIRSLRNIDQHDYMESKENSYVSIMDITRPYIIANINNYMETYNEIFNLADVRCNVQVSKTHCSCRKILSPHDISDRIFIPWSYNSIFRPGKLLWKDEGNYFNSLNSLNHLLAELDLKLLNSDKKLTEAKSKLKACLETENNPQKVSGLKNEIKTRTDMVKSQSQEKYELEQKIRIVEKITDNFYEENEFADTTIRKEFFHAISSFKENKEDIFRLKLEIIPSTWLLTRHSSEKLAQNKSTDILETIKVNSIKEYLENFKYTSIGSVRKALLSDPEISDYIISPSKMHSLEDEISHFPSEIYFGEYFGVKRYTEEFYSYCKNRILGIL